jgi:phenylacetate-coenzyme A ligase PaaK-like adenylate-forming protein
MKKDPKKVAAAYKGLLDKTITSPSGLFSAEDYKRWLQNLLTYSVPIYLGVLFTQLAAGVNWKSAALNGLPVFYGAMADYIKKRQVENIYKVDAK